MRRMEAVIHARCQPQRHIAAVAMRLDERRIAQQILQRVGKSLGLIELGAVDRAAGADDGVARADQDVGRAVDRARAVLELADEAVVQAAELGLFGFAQIEVGEQPPERDREVADERLLDLAEPADELGRQPPRNAVGEQEIDVFLLEDPQDLSPALSCDCKNSRRKPRFDGTAARLSPSTASARRRVATSVVTLRKRLELSQAKHRSLAGHSRGWRGGSPASCRSTITTRSGSSVPTARRPRSPRGAATASRGFRRFTRRALPKRSGAPPRRAEIISDLQFTDAYRVPFQYSRMVRTHLPSAAFVAIVERRHGDRSRRQSLLRPHRLLRRQCAGLRLLQGRDRARRRARARAWPGARPLSPADRRERGNPQARFPGSTKSRSTCRAPRR